MRRLMRLSGQRLCRVQRRPAHYPLRRVFFCLLFGYTNQTDTTEAKDMATKKKQVEQDATAPVEQQLTEHQQAILEHYGQNSAEFAEAMRGE